MAESKPKRAVEIIRDEKNPVVEVPQSKADFKALIEAYAKKSPEKYELKKASLQAQLDAMK